ncbi:MAG: ribosome assembly cofactor RimP [Bacteroidales bacterium]|nr:ribosome assembly cofactor RimP [Bacteroidales bacterium]
MINKKTIEEIVKGQIIDLNIVLVDIQISSSNSIKVFLDSENGVSISDCVKISRSIEGQLDRDKEDFELEVSSYGLFSPFKILLHYKKNLGKEVEVYLNEGQNFKGVLNKIEHDEDGVIDYIEIMQKKKKKLEGKKKKIEIEEIIKVKKEEIKKIKLVPKF